MSTSAIQHETKIAQLIRARNAIKRRHGYDSDEYFDANEKVDDARFLYSLYKKEQRRIALKAEVESRKAERKAISIAAAPIRKASAQQKAIQRRQAKRYRKEYTKAYEEAQTEWLSGFNTDSYVEPTSSTEHRDTMTGTTPFQYSAIDGHFQGRTFPVHSHIKELEGNSAQIMSDINKVMRRDVTPWLEGILKEKKSIKVTPYMSALMNNVNGNKDKASEVFNTPWQRTDMLTEGTNIGQWLIDAGERMLARIDEVPSLRLRQVLTVSFTVAVAGFEKGGSYIPLPEHIAGKKCCVNVNLERYSPTNKQGCNNTIFMKHKDSCFLFSVLAALYPVDIHAERVGHYIDHVAELDMTDIDEPVSLKDIPRFMKKNPKVSINVYGWTEEEGTHILFLTQKSEVKEHHVNLMLLQNPKDHEVSHYVLLKHLDRLLNAHTETSHGKSYFCDRCLTHKSTPELLAKHRELPCGDTRIEMPEDGKNEISFKNLSRSLKAPAIIYSDFEALTTVMASTAPETDSFTVREQHHKAISAELRVVVAEEVPTRATYEKTETFVGPDCVQQFIGAIHQNAVAIIDGIIKHVEPMTDVDEQAFKDAKTCYICKRFFKRDQRGSFSKEKNLKKVRDHCHLSGKYRGAACNDCNLNLRMKPEVSVVFHNLRGYDSHLMMRDLGVYINKLNMGTEWVSDWHSKLEPVANTIEKYMSYSWYLTRTTGEMSLEGKPIKKFYKIRFIDSLQFLASSLDSLAKNLTKEDLVYTRLAFGENTDMMSKKGIFPYDWYNDASKNAYTDLPSIEAFHSRLTGESVTPKDYEHAQNVWRTLKCKTFEDYMRAYLKSDVALLADIFEKFRATSLSSYGLDPAHYMTSPSLAWDAAIKKACDAGIIMDNMTDYDQYLFVEKAKRGGVTMISHRHAVADNKYIRKDESERETDSYILYLDANNLYGKAMSERLPIGDYQWDDVLTVEQLMAFPVEGERGLFVECDLEYPEHLHDLHNDYPMAVEKMLVRDGMLSPFAVALGQSTGRTSDKVEKLVPSLQNKMNYVCHIKNFQYYVKSGLVPTKIHKILSFKQQAWLKEYIDYNTDKRSKASSEFEKAFYKLMNNSVFGKTMENVMNRINVDLVTDPKRAVKVSNDPRYQTHIMFDENLVGVHRAKTKVVLNRPIAVGATILDLSKLIMLRFHYDVMMPKYGPERCKLLMTDTDSLVYQITTGDVYRDMVEPEFFKEFDTCDYPKDHPLYTKARAKQLGYMKDEHNGVPVVEFVGLAPKMYSCDDHGKAKGVSKTVSKKLKAGDYRGVLEAAIRVVRGDSSEKPYTTADMMAIRSSRHEMYLIRQRKIALNAYDNKKLIANDGISMYAYGHYKTPLIMAGEL